MKNVVFLSIDSLSYERLVNQERSLKLSPTLDWLLQNGITCTNMFSNGQPTQMAFPTIFSSTLPLDCSGYDRGVKYRKVTLPEVMKNNGFYTVGFCTHNFLGRYYSYDRGFDELYEIYNIKRFWKSMHKNFYSYFLQILNQGLITFVEFVQLIENAMSDSYRYLLWFCEQKLKEIEQCTLKYNNIIHGYNFVKIIEYVSQEFDCFRRNPHTYLVNLNELVDKFSKIINISKYGEGTYGGLMSYVDNTCEQIMVKCQGKLGFSSSYMLKRYDHFVNAEYLKDCMIDKIERIGNRPFFLWAHFYDIHEGNYTSRNIQMPPFSAPSLIKRLRMKKSEQKRYHTYYAANEALRYVDKQIGGLVEYLKHKDLLNETLLVITSDHGMEMWNPIRIGHKATLFYDEYVRVPMIFYNPDVTPKKISNICSHLDLAPTIIDLMGMRSVNEFSGLPVYSKEAQKREYVIMENAGRGPCDLYRKEINITIRTKKFKYMWSESSNANELYNLENDINEERNLIDVKLYSNVIAKLKKLAEERRIQIRDNID